MLTGQYRQHGLKCLVQLLSNLTSSIDDNAGDGTSLQVDLLLTVLPFWGEEGDAATAAAAAIPGGNGGEQHTNGVSDENNSSDDDAPDTPVQRPVWIAPATAEGFFELWDAEALEEERAEQAARARYHQ